MCIEATHTPALSRQPRSVPGWLTTNRLKRGALLYWAALFTGSAAVIHCIGLLAQPPQSGLLVGLIVVQAVIALAVVAAPVRRLLIAAGVVEGVALVFWIVAHTGGDL